VNIEESGTIFVDTDHFYARDTYDPTQAVPARPGARFHTDGLTLLTPASGEAAAMEA
jgi:hypothetical protein